MKIAFLVARPTQFEAPFFRYAASDSAHAFEAWFSDPEPGGAVSDPELARDVTWGFDLLAGYEWAPVPARGVAEWVERRAGERGIDLLIVNGYTRRSERAAAAAARRAGAATALRLDSVLWHETALRRAAKRALFAGVLDRLFDLYLAVGSETRRYLAATGIGEERIGRFPYAVDHERFAVESRLTAEERARERAALGVPREARLILSLTKFHPREAPWDLLAARAAVAREDCWWALAGDGPDRAALERRAREESLTKMCFPGYVPYEHLGKLYGAADLFVHPAREERWGVSIAEAMAAGLPVVASERVGAALDLVLPGENGARYPAGDGAALARAIEATLALDRAAVAATNARVLSAWGYEATWHDLIMAAERGVALAGERGSRAAIERRAAARRAETRP